MTTQTLKNKGFRTPGASLGGSCVLLLDRWFIFRRFPGLVIVSLVPLLALSLHQAGLLEPFDGWLRDRFVQYVPLSVEDTGRVLVVEQDPDAAPIDALTSIRAIDRVIDLGARLVVLLDLPHNADDAFLKVLSNQPVIVGRKLHENIQDLEPKSLERWPSTPKTIQQGVVKAPELVGGVSRFFVTTVKVNDDTLPTLSQAVTLALNHKAMTPPRVFIDFGGFPQSFPDMDLVRLLNGGLTRELVENKVVLLANGASHAQFGIPVPSTHGVIQVSTAVWQGLAIDASLSGRTWSMTPWWLSALLLIITGVIALILLPHGHSRSGLKSLAFLSIAGIFLAVGSLWWFLTWPPLTAVLLTLLWSRIFSSRVIMRRNSNTLWHLSTHLSQNDNDRLASKDPTKTVDPWPELTHLARQILPMRRMICLEMDSADQRLVVARSFLCESGDLVEKRRDVSRSPWKDAIDEWTPLKISELPTARPMLVQREDEDQYIIPLKYANELCGFWVLCVDQSAVASIPRFREVTQVIADDIAAQLHHRRLWQRQQQSLVKPWLSYFSFELSDFANNRLSQSMFRLEDRLGDLEDLFDQLDDATLCFDMFGRVAFVNQEMTRLLSHSQTDVFASSPLHFILQLTDLSEPEARDILQSIVLSHDEVMLTVKDQWSEKNRDFIVRIYAIHEETDNDTSGVTESNRPINGIVFQVTNLETVTEPHRLKTLLAQRLDYSIRNRLTSVQTASALLHGDSIAADVRDKVLQTIKRDTQEIADTLETARPYLHPETGTQAEHLVMDTRAGILSTTDKLKTLATRNQLEFVINMPKLPYLVRGNARHFREGLRGVLELLIDEAYEDTTIDVQLSQGDDDLFLKVTNTGFGIPAERLSSFLFDDDDVDSEKIRSIRTLNERVKAWGGELKVDSKVGSGITFTVLLPKLL